MKTRNDITIEKVYRSVHAVGINGDYSYDNAMEVFRCSDNTWRMGWAHYDYRTPFETMEEAIEAAIPHVLANANRVRGF